MNKNYRYNRSTKNFQAGGSKLTKYQGKEVSQTGPGNPNLSRNVAAGTMAGLGAIGAALSFQNNRRKALKAAEAGDFASARNYASQIKRDKKALKTRRDITKIQNQAGAADFKRRGGAKRRRK
jgi:hypothetical protein